MSSYNVNEMKSNSHRHKDITRLILYYFKKHPLFFGCGFFSIIASSVFSVIIPLMLRDAINVLEQSGKASQLLNYALMIVGLAVASGIFKFLTMELFVVVSRKIEYDLRNEFFSHLESLDQQFYQNNPAGDLVSRATNDIEAIREIFGPGLVGIGAALFMSAFSLILMYRVDPVLTGYSLLLFPLLSLTIFLLGKQVQKRSHIVQRQLGNLSAFVRESLSGIRVIQAFAKENVRIQRFDRLNKQFIDSFMRMARIWELLIPTVFLISGIVLIIILIEGGRRVIDGVITLGAFVAIIYYLRLVIWPLAGLGWVIGTIQRGIASHKRLREILSYQPTVVSPGKADELSGIRGKLEFRNLDFGFESEGKILKDISFKVKPGSKIAIVGPTGCGKSTLLSLIPRIHPVSFGKIFIDNVDINSLDLAQLRASIAFIPQETFLFSESLYENIVLGAQSDVTQERVREIAKVAELFDHRKAFPDGLNTIIGEKGVTLSGGQKQRVAIARALLKDAPVLVIDDAFSAIDSSTEGKILENLSAFWKEKTVIISSTRLSTIKDAKQIIVLDEGGIVETGTHNALMSKDGLYAKMYKKQLLERELEKS
ncbi:MAG: ATP-binding cassette domain-containing protein [candidate division Zixibacteria bacterium]|nr:ATP-binding cassette domain-containing protein [candidate division Zixibacteria bacterium]